MMIISQNMIIKSKNFKRYIEMISSFLRRNFRDIEIFLTLKFASMILRVNPLFDQ